jgi:hypothetical protein
LTGNDLTVQLKDILNSVNVANGALAGNAIGLNILKRQGTVDDLNEVGAVLAQIITDIVEAVEGLADDLKALPLVVSCPSSILVS